MRTSVLSCFWCLKQNDVDIDDPNKATAQFRNKIHGFCNANISNVVDLLMALIKFTKEAGMPGALPDRVVAVTKLADKLSATPGMNQPTSGAEQPRGAATSTPASANPKAGSGSSAAAAAASSSPSLSPMSSCWGQAACKATIGKFIVCRGQIGDIKDPNNIIAESVHYQSCLCDADFKK